MSATDLILGAIFTIGMFVTLAGVVNIAAMGVRWLEQFDWFASRVLLGSDYLAPGPGNYIARPFGVRLAGVFVGVVMMRPEQAGHDVAEREA